GRVLGEKAVARVHGVGVRLTGGLEQRREVQVALASVRRPDADRFVGLPNVERVLVRRRVDGDGGETELATRAQDADGDLPAVGEESLVQWRSARSARGR